MYFCILAEKNRHKNMKIAIAQLNFVIGDFEGNVNKMLDAVAEAKPLEADIICFNGFCYSLS